MEKKAIRVMIVDDHPGMRLGLAAILKNASDMAVVGEAGSGEEAIERFAQLFPDVTIVDICLPGISGIDTIRMLRRAYPDAKFLAITAHLEDQDIQNAQEAGASGYLLKGMSYRTLLDSLRSIHQGEKSFLNHSYPRPPCGDAFLVDGVDSKESDQPHCKCVV